MAAEEHGPADLLQRVDLVESSRDVAALPAILDAADGEASAVDAHLCGTIEDRIAEDVRGIDVDVAVGQFVADEIDAAICTDRPPAVGLEQSIDLFAKRYIDDVKRLVADGELRPGGGCHQEQGTQGDDRCGPFRPALSYAGRQARDQGERRVGGADVAATADHRLATELKI